MFPPANALSFLSSASPHPPVVGVSLSLCPSVSLSPSLSVRSTGQRGTGLPWPPLPRDGPEHQKTQAQLPCSAHSPLKPLLVKGRLPLTQPLAQEAEGPGG